MFLEGRDKDGLEGGGKNYQHLTFVLTGSILGAATGGGGAYTGEQMEGQEEGKACIEQQPQREENSGSSYCGESNRGTSAVDTVAQVCQGALPSPRSTS
jgi:hypothetical protein